MVHGAIAVERRLLARDAGQCSDKRDDDRRGVLLSPPALDVGGLGRCALVCVVVIAIPRCRASGIRRCRRVSGQCRRLLLFTVEGCSSPMEFDD
ncbi:hypothetical protein Dimus_018405 [Dionaea muscipula]